MMSLLWQALAYKRCSTVLRVWEGLALVGCQGCQGSQCDDSIQMVGSPFIPMCQQSPTDRMSGTALAAGPPGWPHRGLAPLRSQTIQPKGSELFDMCSDPRNLPQSLFESFVRSQSVLVTPWPEQRTAA